MIGAIGNWKLIAEHPGIKCQAASVIERLIRSARNWALHQANEAGIKTEIRGPQLPFRVHERGSAAFHANRLLCLGCGRHTD